MGLNYGSGRSGSEAGSQPARLFQFEVQCDGHGRAISRREPEARAPFISHGNVYQRVISVIVFV